MRGRWALPMPRWRMLTFALVGMTVVVIGWAVVSSAEELPSIAVADFVLLIAFTVWITVGSLLDVRLPLGSIVISPVSIAVATALPMVTSWRSLVALDGGHSHVVHFGLGLVVLAVVVGQCAGAGLARLFGLVRVGWAQRCSLILSVLGTGLIFRPVPNTPWPAWQSMLLMLASAAVPGMVWICLIGLLQPGRNSPRAVAESLLQLAPMGAACVATATAIAFGTQALGTLAAPLVAAPLVLMRFAIQQQERQRSTRRQSIVALARLTEVAGYTRAGHSRQVAQLCRSVGERMGLTEGQLSVLEDAALLHDIGQVSLDRPIPDGATTEAAPLDQRAIAEHGAAIVRRTGRMNGVAAILEEQATPYHLTVTEGLDIDVGSRILKVCNAYADHLAGEPGRHTLAMERLDLGLGYEYDPRVIEALHAVLGEYAAAR